MAQNDKKISLLQLISQEQFIIWLLFMVHFCEMMMSQGVVFYFFKIFILCVVKGEGSGGVKGKKMVQNEKFCLSCSISQKSHIIWFWFMVLMCKMIISPVVFFIFSKFWFFGLLGGSKGKKSLKITKKLCSLHFISQEPYIIWSWFMMHMCKRIIYPGVFSIFCKF